MFYYRVFVGKVRRFFGRLIMINFAKKFTFDCLKPFATLTKAQQVYFIIKRMSFVCVDDVMREILTFPYEQTEQSARGILVVTYKDDSALYLNLLTETFGVFKYEN